MNCQQICKAIDPCSHCCHFCISQEWSECLFFAKTSPLECCIYSAAKIKYTLHNLLLVSLNFKCIFTWHQTQISPEDFKVPALCPLLRFQQYSAASPCPTHPKRWRRSFPRAEQPAQLPGTPSCSISAPCLFVNKLILVKVTQIHTRLAKRKKQINLLFGSFSNSNLRKEWK